MGNLKKKDGASNPCKSKDEKQTKISSFFGNKVLPCQKESALFTKICSDRSESKKDSALRGGHNSTKQGPKPVATQSMSMKDNKENKEDEVMIVVCDDFQEDGINRSVIARPVVNSTSETKELKPKDQRGDCRGKQNITLPKERLNSDEISKESPVDNADFQPQTNVSESALANCVFDTPDKKIQNIEHLSPDIICDTPGVDLELERSRTRKRQLSASRSFLCLSDRVSVQPGLKPAHLRAQRKVRPSKLFGKVSISFNTKSKSESDSTSSASFVANTTEMAGDQKQSKPMETDDVFGSGQDGVTCESSALLSEKPCSIPETQLEERHKDPSTRVDDEIEQYFSEGDEPQKCRVFDQSAHELDMTVDKYLVAVESLEPDEVETEINQFSKKSMSWDRTEGRAGKDPLFNKKLSDNAEPKTICGKSKLLGALETAEVRAKEKEDETAWLKDRVMREVGLLENKSSSGSGCKDTTPVKIYPGKTLTVKRLAKAGESPLSKRNYFSDCQSTEKTFLGEGNNDSFTSGIKKVLSFDSHSAKVSSKRYHKFTRQRAVEFGLKPKEKISAAGDKITLKDDRLLADLLGDLNSPGGRAKSVMDNDSTRYHKSTSLKSKKAINIKVSKEDEKLLDSLFGESFTGVDNDFGKGGISFSPIKSAAADQTEPILIDDSEQPVVNGNDECIVVEADSYYVETIANDNELPSEEKGTILTKLASISAEEMRQSELRTSTGATTFIEKARPEKSSGSSTSLTNDAIDQRGNHSNVLSTENLSLDNSSAIDISNLEAEESKIPVSVYTDDQLSTSVCNMLSESFGDEFLAPQLPPPQGTKKKHQDFVFTDLWNRFYVEDTKYYRQQDELVLDLTCERSNSLRQCVLRGFWVDTEVKKGDIVNVLADLEQGRYIVDDKKGLVVVNPDILLSGTLVVSAVFCPRKSVLKEQFKGVDKGNVQMLYGSIIHSLFQEVLRDGVAQEKDVEKLAVSRLKSNKFLHEMYGQNLAESTVMEEVKQYIPSLIEWLHKHTSVSNNSSTTIKPVKKPDVMVSEIQDIEENIWSPRFGIKGKIDLTVKAKVSSAGKIPEAKVLPLELKTGKASFSSEHKGQVQLYSMMCSDRRADPQEGILLYLKNGQMETVPVKPESQSGLVQLRNKLAKDLSRQVTMETDEAGNSVYQLGSLPKPINNERACSKCAHLQTCSIYQRSVEKIERPAGHAMSTLVPQALAHLGGEDLTYFLHWVLCLDVEGQVSGRRQLQEIWCSSSWQREKDGECLSNLVITGSELGIPESQSFNDGQGCSLFFSRHSDCEGAALNSVGLTSGDMVVLSSEDGRLIALATGFVRNISATVVEIVVDRDYLHNTEAYQGMKFRLDRNSSFSTSGYLFTNLAQLMNPDPQGSWLRDLIIKKRPPEFELKVSKANLYKVKSVFKPLNKPQRTAILKVLMAKDYVLIKGFPGTGKTSTIVALVKILHLLGLSVLLTSYTHSAVDNILLKLKKEDVPFVRLGRQGRIHPSILPCSAEVLTRSPSINSVQALREFYGSFSVVATSCLGVSNHPVFSQRHFDICIVDEASQVLQPACLAPLFHCRKFVLVGDPKQLPPVVQSKEAKKLGMDVSLFAQLDNRGATYDLSLQYRMNSVIMDLSNKLVYDGRLECGDPSVAEQCLKIDHSTLEDQPQWMKAAMSTQPQNSVVFVDTQQISAPELQDGKGLKNETEARIVLSLLKTLISGHVSGSSIGVISPYRSQVRLLQKMVAECSTVADVEVNTVDQYQGRDKGVIIVSFVRSQKQNEGELLKDLRRLNVALTRARYKLILVGNSSALQVYENLAALLDWLHPSQNVITIPEDYTPDS